MEILVIDGDSDDETVSIARSVAADDPRARILRNPGRIVSRALNIGIDAARGEVIIRVDGHTVIAPDYVRRCVECLRATGADNVGGPQRFVGLTPMGRAIAVAYRSPFGVPSRFTTSRRAEYADTVYMGAWPRAVFERVGRFDESLIINQDYEHNYRIRKAGGRIYLSPDIRSEYYGRQTLRGLWRQFFRYGEGKFAVLAKHPTSTRPRHLVAPAFVAALIGGAVVALFSRRIARLWRIILVSYGLANAASAIQAARRDGSDLLPRLPLIFACIHLAWGSGFWRAALRWWREQVAHG
jgi:glycosyltransferase involved in cell wall biosynthesis